MDTFSSVCFGKNDAAFSRLLLLLINVLDPILVTFIAID